MGVGVRDSHGEWAGGEQSDVLLDCCCCWLLLERRGVAAAAEDDDDDDDDDDEGEDVDDFELAVTRAVVFLVSQR